VPSTGSTIDIEAHDTMVLVDVSVGGAGADKYAIGGSLAINEIRNTINATVTDANGAATGVASALSAPGDVTVLAKDSSLVVAVTGGGAGSSGGSAVGAAI